MANTQTTLDFDFDSIYSGIVKKFEDKGYDAPYEGSNLAQLITAMSYTVSMLNANTAANINETILPLATKTKNILQDARLLGYEAEHATAYKYILNLKVPDGGTLYIPKYTEFKGSGHTYYYTGDDIELFGLDPDYELSLIVKEGTLYKSDDYDFLNITIGTDQYVDVPLPDVASEGLEVLVTYYKDDGSLIENETWTRSPIIILDSDSKLSKEFIRMDNIELGTPRIYFEISGIGNPLPLGSTVLINALTTIGSLGELTETPTCELSNIEVLSYSIVTKGTDEESDDSIKTNAPLLYNTASRVITADDYQVVCNRHSSVEDSKAWGGEDEYPVKLGHIYLSMVPERRDRVFTPNDDSTLFTLGDSELDTNLYLLESDYISSTLDVNGNILNPGVYDILDTVKLPALKLNKRNPVYLNIDVTLKIIKYNSGVNRQNLRNRLFNILDSYMQSIEGYSSEFFKSNIIKRIDTEITDITGVELSTESNLLLDSGSLVTENGNDYENDIFIFLSSPYESLFNNDGSLNPDNLPRLSAENFKGVDDLYVDIDSFTPNITDINQDVISVDIKLGNDVVGSYDIFISRRLYIRAKLFVQADVLDGFSLSPKYASSTLKVSDFDTPKYISLDYITENFRVERNTVLRLNSLSIS